MKKTLIVLALAAAATWSSWADGSSVTVQNQESWRFWFVLDPTGFAEESPGSPWLTLKATDYLATEGEEFPFTELAPGGSTTLTGLSEGTHYLLGFFEDQSLEELPVRLIALQADDTMGTRHYDVYSVPELMMAVRGQGMLARFSVTETAAAATDEPTAETVEGEAAEEPLAEEQVVEEVTDEVVAEAAEEVLVEEPAAETIEEGVEAVVAEETVAEEPVGSEVLAAFADSYDPVYFTRESRDGFIVLPIASSRSWGRPGTRLSALDGSLADGTITLVLRSPDGFAKNSSCFIYIFPTRTAGGASTYTFEVRPDADGRAAVVLWQKGRAVPRLVGTARTDGGEFTWTAGGDELPPELVRELGPAATFDLTTAWLDETSGTWEEFYFTTFALADFTR